MRDIRRHCVCVVLALATSPSAGMAQEDHHHSHGLHFSHPLFTESVSPDTKLRIDLGKEWESEGNSTETELEAELALDRSVSVEVAVPYVFLDPELEPATSGAGNIEVALKFANFAFERHGVLLGYGLAVGLPTGDAEAGTGTDHIWELEPFLNVGLAVADFEFVAWGRFGIPTNQQEGEDVETDFSYDLSVLYHISSRLQGLVELNGQTGLSGEEASKGTATVAPGIKVAPLANSPLFVGLGIGLPVSDQDLDARVKLSVFWHF